MNTKADVTVTASIPKAWIMEQPKRTLYELKIALALLHINSSTNSSHHRIISSTAIIFCWRHVPADTLIEVLRSRIKGKTAQATFEALISRNDELQLGDAAYMVEAFLSARTANGTKIGSAIRHPEFKRAILGAVAIPPEFQPPMVYSFLCRATHDDRSTVSSTSICYNHVPVKQVYTTYPIYYGTDRLLERGRTIKFGGFRGSGSVAYGVAEVSVPDIHREGKLERQVGTPARPAPSDTAVVNRTLALPGDGPYYGLPSSRLWPFMGRRSACMVSRSAG